MITDEKYLELIKKLNNLSKEYYTLDNPTVSDSEYDLLYKKVKEYEKLNPIFISSDSPTQRVGDKVLAKFEKKNHISKMWSLDNIFNIQEFKDLSEKIEETIFYCDPKFDGASLNLIYKNGKLSEAITRGDGTVGENVTQNAKKIKTVPQEIPYFETIEIRGEVVILKADFKRLNESSEREFSNPRNTSAGSLRQLDSSVTERRRLTFIPYGIGSNSLEFKLHSEVMNFIFSLGFKKTQSEVTKSIDEVEKFYLNILENREENQIELDGIVIKVDNLEKQKSLGYGIKSPKWAIAFKFPAVEQKSELLNIVWQVGRTGALTPVAEIEPTEVGGVIVKRVTLHNFDEIERLKIKIGSDITIVRRGDVIPKILSASGGVENISIPKQCPVCESILFQDKAILKCQNISCQAITVNSIEYFMKSMDIKGIGKQVVETLFKNGLLKDIEQIFTLSKESILEFDGFKERRTSNILEAIENSIGDRELWRFITGLGIYGVGEVNAKLIAKEFGISFLDKTSDEYLELEGFGDETVNSIISFIDMNREKVTNLLKVVKPKVEDKNIELDLPFSGKRFAITGTLSKSRKEFVKLIEINGGTFSSSITKSVDILILGEGGGSKLKKAEALEIQVYKEVQFLKKLLN